MRVDGTKLAARRIAAGYTREGFADAVSLSYQTIAAYECDRRTPATESLLRITDVLGCTVDDLLTDQPLLPRRRRQQPPASDGGQA